jgi:chromosome segregation ATPase
MNDPVTELHERLERALRERDEARDETETWKSVATARGREIVQANERYDTLTKLFLADKPKRDETDRRYRDAAATAARLLDRLVAGETWNRELVDYVRRAREVFHQAHHQNGEPRDCRQGVCGWPVPEQRVVPE